MSITRAREPEDGALCQYLQLQRVLEDSRGSCDITWCVSTDSRPSLICLHLIFSTLFLTTHAPTFQSFLIFPFIYLILSHNCSCFAWRAVLSISKPWILRTQVTCHLLFLIPLLEIQHPLSSLSTLSVHFFGRVSFWNYNYTYVFHVYIHSFIHSLNTF